MDKVTVLHNRARGSDDKDRLSWHVRMSCLTVPRLLYYRM